MPVLVPQPTPQVGDVWEIEWFDESPKRHRIISIDGHGRVKTDVSKNLDRVPMFEAGGCITSPTIWYTWKRISTKSGSKVPIVCFWRDDTTKIPWDDLKRLYLQAGDCPRGCFACAGATACNDSGWACTQKCYDIWEQRNNSVVPQQQAPPQRPEVKITPWVKTWKDPTLQDGYKAPQRRMYAPRRTAAGPINVCVDNEEDI